MQNERFNVTFDYATGGIKSLYIVGDGAKMNWVKDGHAFNVPKDYREPLWDRHDFTYVSLTEKDGECVAVFEGDDLTWTVTYRFNEDGNLVVRNELKNKIGVEIFLPKGMIGLALPFFDDYKDAATCIPLRCNTHVWCGGASSYVCALKMGPSKHNLGLVLTEGGFDCYSQHGVRSNDRGVFVLHPDAYLIKGGESYVLSYELLTCEGKENFKEMLRAKDGFSYIEFDETGLFLGEEVCFRVYGGAHEITVDGRAVEFDVEDGIATVCLPADVTGEHSVAVTVNGRVSTAKYIVHEPIESMVERRLNFIIDRQQYSDPGSKLDGAFLIYDVEEERMQFDNVQPDHNASRERLGMGLLLAEYVKKNGDSQKHATALKRYLDFIKREIYDESTGEVFDTVGRFSPWVRLYNIPWVARLFMESYYALGTKELLLDMKKAMEFYYREGGNKFYPNGISMYQFVEALRDGGFEAEAEELKALSLSHIEQIIERGLNYPKHEVNYEQTIVTPAVAFILDGYRLTGDQRYIEAVKPHMDCLDRFDGFQPHYKLNRIAIRYWDDYWFGKRMTHGDTLPHYWTALSGNCYIRYGECTGDERAIKEGLTCLRNTLCLFPGDGTGSCACVFPFRVNEMRGDFMDPWCNDQDFALYYAYLAFCK